MQLGLKAMKYHVTSSDDNPRHEFCPRHRPAYDRKYESYCFWKRYEYRLRCAKMKFYENQKKKRNANASKNAKSFYGKKKEEPVFDESKFAKPSHKSMNVRLDFPEGSFQYKAFMGLMDRLSDENLLKRCIDNRTQNPNESFHKKIWNMCPKDRYYSKSQMDFSINQNILIHHLGYEKGSLLNDFGIRITKHMKALWSIKEKARVKLRPIKMKTRKKRDVYAYKPSQKDYHDEYDDEDDYSHGGSDDW